MIAGRGSHLGRLPRGGGIWCGLGEGQDEKAAQSGQREQQEQRRERGRRVRHVVGRSGLGDGEGVVEAGLGMRVGPDGEGFCLSHCRAPCVCGLWEPWKVFEQGGEQDQRQESASS